MTSKFYSGRSILITGATGFIGKVLIEKLLYSCPDLDKIYLLIRSSKGRSPHDRLVDMIEQKPFNIRLKKEFVLTKLVSVDSDLALEGLGLSDEIKSKLIAEVSIIFHVAASVKFEAPLEVNMRHNVLATKELLEFACSFKNLACFVHVSTAYSNCQLLHIEERVYHMEVPDDPMALKVTNEMIDNRPNTYTYTKAMAENVANQYANRINVVIVRPSIVMSSLKEPAEGWVDTINGPVGLSVLGALGILQKIKVNSEVVFDLIPVDIVTNALLSIAWAATEHRSKFNLTTATRPTVTNGKTKATNADPPIADEQSNGATETSKNNNNDGPKKSKESDFKSTLLSPLSLSSLTSSIPQPDGRVCVFNLTTGSENPCSFYHYFNTGRQEAYEKPSIRALRPLLHIPKQKGMNPIQYWMHKVVSHLFFAYLMDILLGLLGHKKMVVKSVNRMHHANEVFDYFCSNQWNFNSDNVKQLRLLQSIDDRDTFNCDVREIDWDIYARLGWLGCRRFILKESDDSMSYAKKRYQVICFLYYSMKLILLATIFYITSRFIDTSSILTMFMIPVGSILYLM